MTNTIPVVKVACDNEQGFYLINASDFDPKKHILFLEKNEEDGDLEAESSARPRRGRPPKGEQK